MKYDKLKPYVHKVDGPVNFTLFNLLNGQFYQFSTEGTIEELRHLLIEEDLIYQTDLITRPEVIKPNLWEMQNRIYLRKLLIRLNGTREDNCWNRKKIPAHATASLAPESLERLILDCRDIPIQQISIEAETEEYSLIEQIINGFDCPLFEIYIQKGVPPTQKNKYDSLCQDKNVVFLADGKRNMMDYQVEMFHFFYTQTFNACLGHQIALDADGSLRPCLWSEDTLGHISVTHLKEIILRGDLDKYWYAAKNHIETCKDCEFKNVCHDCRISAIQNNGNPHGKPTYCTYNPYTGTAIP